MQFRAQRVCLSVCQPGWVQYGGLTSVPMLTGQSFALIADSNQRGMIHIHGVMIQLRGALVKVVYLSDR